MTLATIALASVAEEDVDTVVETATMLSTMTTTSILLMMMMTYLILNSPLTSIPGFPVAQVEEGHPSCGSWSGTPGKDQKLHIENLLGQIMTMIGMELQGVSEDGFMVPVVTVGGMVWIAWMNSPMTNSLPKTKDLDEGNMRLVREEAATGETQ